MPALVDTLLKSDSAIFNEGVRDIFNALFEEISPSKANSRDAIDILQQRVGENVNRTDDGSHIVGLAAQAGMGDGDPLNGELDQLINEVNADEAHNVDLPPLPTEADVPDLPQPNPQPAEEPTQTADSEISFEDAQTDISDTPPPDDMELPIDFGDDGGEEAPTEDTPPA